MLEKLNVKIIQNPHHIYGGAANSAASIVTEDIIDG
jgi:hypothetical protein